MQINKLMILRNILIKFKKFQIKRKNNYWIQSIITDNNKLIF